MERYYFHISDGDVVAEDPDGKELASFPAAFEEAVWDARQLLADGALAGVDRQHWRIDVVSNERPVFSLPFKDAVRPGSFRSLIDPG